MLHAGRATAFTSIENGEYKRLHTITTGWFNTECLIEHLPCAYSVVADQDCDLVVITEPNLSLMEDNEPDLLVVIQRRILRLEALLRQRLKREVTAVELEATHQGDDQHPAQIQQPHIYAPQHVQYPNETLVHRHVEQRGRRISVRRPGTAAVSMSTRQLEEHDDPADAAKRHTAVDGGWLLHDKHHLHFSFFHALFHQGHAGEADSDVPFWLPPTANPTGDTSKLLVRPRLSLNMLHEAEEAFLQHSNVAGEFGAEVERAELALRFATAGSSMHQRAGGSILGASLRRRNSLSAMFEAAGWRVPG